MQRYFLLDHQFEGAFVSIVEEDAKHIQRVMRMVPGDTIICCNEKAESFLCEVTEFKQEQVLAKVIEQIDEHPELPVNVTIAQALPKGDKLDLIMQKGTELGATSFMLFHSERSIVKWEKNKLVKKLMRLKKIVKEAAEQSHRIILPELAYHNNLNELILSSNDFDYKVVAYEEEAKLGHHHALPQLLKKVRFNEKILVLIGPEGGLSTEEINKLEQADFIKVGLGRRILRTETASLYVLSALSYQFELLNEVNE